MLEYDSGYKTGHVNEKPHFFLPGILLKKTCSADKGEGWPDTHAVGRSSKKNPFQPFGQGHWCKNCQ